MSETATTATRFPSTGRTSAAAVKDSGALAPSMTMGAIDVELEELYRRRHAAFQVMLASVTGSVESARDVVQEAFAQALRDQSGFRGEGPLEAWVWRIAFRVAIGSKGSRELTTDEVPEVTFVDKSADPALAAAVRELPAQRRLVVFLRYFADLSYAEIGATLGIAEGTVAATLSQAHAQLGAALATNDLPPNEVVA
jgi:RNA polymerase sigma-70 factor (ECF subfamily)